MSSTSVGLSSAVKVVSSNGTTIIMDRLILSLSLSFSLSLSALWTLLVLSTIPTCHADNSPFPGPHHITLPDGSNSSDIYLVGTFDDHRLADENDYTLVECDSSGDMLCYAQQDDATGDLISTGTTIENPPPDGLQPGEDASLERKEELCGQLCLDKQLEPLSNCVYLTDAVSSSPETHVCPTPLVQIFDANVHKDVGTGTEHAQLDLEQYFDADGVDVDGDAVCTANLDRGVTVQYTDLNGVNQCEDYSKKCGNGIPPTNVQCEADGYGTITLHYNTDPLALAATVCASSPLPANTCSYSFRVRCAAECALDRRRRSLQDAITTSPTVTPGPTNITNLVVLFQFSDHAGRVLPPTQEYDKLMNDHDYSVRDVFLQSSNGNLILNSDVLDWVTLDPLYTEAYCAGGRSGGVVVFHECLKNALDKIDSLVDFLFYDSDGDDMIDSITFFHSGFAAEWGQPDEYGTVYQDRIWSHKWGMYPYWTSFEGVRVGKYHVNPGVWGVSGSSIGRIGVVAHETAHALGLKDRYDTSGVGNGLGSYSLMANSWGFDGSQRYPPKLSPCDKMELGWAQIVELTSLGTYTLKSQCDSDIIYKVGDGKFGLPLGEFFLFENRQNCGYDKLVDPGLAIYHYDSKALDVMTDDRNDPLYGKPQGFPGAEGFPADGKHYKCALVQADGLYELEKGANQGNPGDLFRPGQVFGPSDDPQLGPFPNTDAYQDGNLNYTGIVIHVGDFFFDSNTGSTGSTTGADSTGIIRGRNLQQATPSISFTLDATDGSPAAADGATLSPNGPPTASRHPSSVPTLTYSSNPSLAPSSSPVVPSSDRPSASPSLTASGRPSTTPSIAPVNADSARPSTYPSSSPVLADSAQPSSQPSGAPSHSGSAQPSPHPSVLPTNVESAKPSAVPSAHPMAVGSARPSTSPSTTASNQPSSRPSGSPVFVASSFPSSIPSPAATVTTSAGNTITGTPSPQPSPVPSSLLPDPYATNSSVCKESQILATDIFVLRTVLFHVQTEGEMEVTVEYKGDGDLMWSQFCHATNVVGQYPEYTLLPESACTALTVLHGEQVKLRLTAQPTSSSNGGGVGVIRRARSVLGEQDMMPGRQRLDSMYSFEEHSCTSSSTI